MQPKSTLPTAEVTVVPLRAPCRGPGGRPPADRTAARAASARCRERRDISGRSRVSCDAGAPERRHFAGRAVAGLYRLALASGGVAAAADRDFAGGPGRDAKRLLRSRAAFLLARAGAVVADQAAAAGPALRPAGVGTAAVQSDGAGVSARRTMVAQRHHRRARRCEAERGDRRVLGPADAGRAVAVQFRRDQSRSAAEGVPERRREFRVRLAELLQRLDAAVVGGQGSRSRPAISSSAKPSRRRAARSCSATS